MTNLSRNSRVMNLYVSFLAIMIFIAFVTTTSEGVSESVVLREYDDEVVIANGILELSLSKPQGNVIGIKYNGVENLLKYSRSRRDLGGYWDITWSSPPPKQISSTDMLEATEYKAVNETEDQVEVSFKRTWTPSMQNIPTLNIDKRFVMLRGVSGFYSYATFEHEKGMPSFDLAEARLIFKLGPGFDYMAISDTKQRKMPNMEDRQPPRGEQLAYKEALLLVKPIEPQFQGEVDDKYQYSLDNKDNRVHGWVRSDPQSTSFWLITPSDEFKTGGPTKQDLTSHVGPFSIAMLIGDHYVGSDIHFTLEEGEYWKKTFGPMFIYLNSNSTSNGGNVQRNLWEDAKSQMQNEVMSWPYNFPASEEYLKSNQRGSITGTLSVRDWYISKKDIPADTAYIGLAVPGELGSWQKECKAYQFWNKTDSNGYFAINNVRPGNYSLYAWVPGFLGDFMHNTTISISEGSKFELGELIYYAPRAAPTLWEIGIPDRSAAEFYVPDPNPKYINTLFVNSTEKYRQYGLWERYTELYPKDDLVYQIGTSNYTKDWFFAQVLRNVGNSYKATTWQIKFRLAKVESTGLYMLRIALSTAVRSRLQVRVNNPIGDALLVTGEFGEGNVIARHGIHGLQWNFDVQIDGKILYEGDNTIYLMQSRADYMFNGIMYDYIRLEGPYFAKTSRKMLL